MMACLINRFVAPAKPNWLNQLVSILFLLLVSGCAAPPISTATYSATSNASRQSRDGLFMEAEIVSDKSMLAELFGVEDLGDNVIAVHATVANKSAEKMYLLLPQNFRLASLPKSDAGSNQDVQGMSPEAAKATSVGVGTALAVAPVIVAPVALPVLISGLRNQACATILRNNLVRREFKSSTLLSGDSASGFLYFQLPPQTTVIPLKLDITLLEAGGEGKVALELKLPR